MTIPALSQNSAFKIAPAVHGLTLPFVLEIQVPQDLKHPECIDSDTVILTCQSVWIMYYLAFFLHIGWWINESINGIVLNLLHDKN